MLLAACCQQPGGTAPRSVATPRRFFARQPVAAAAAHAAARAATRAPACAPAPAVRVRSCVAARAAGSRGRSAAAAGAELDLTEENVTLVLLEAREELSQMFDEKLGMTGARCQRVQRHRHALVRALLPCARSLSVRLRRAPQAPPRWPTWTARL
jgi:hypothetical protein